MDTATQAIGRVRAEIRQYLCKQRTLKEISNTLQSLGLEISLAAEGVYTFRLPAPGPALTQAQQAVVEEMPSLHAVDPPACTPAGITIHGYDLECLPAMLTELTGCGLLTL